PFHSCRESIVSAATPICQVLEPRPTSARCIYDALGNLRSSDVHCSNHFYPFEALIFIASFKSPLDMSFRAEQADFFFSVRSCEHVGLRSRGISLLPFLPSIV